MEGKQYTVMVWCKDLKSYVLVRFNLWSTITVAEMYANNKEYDDYIIVDKKDIKRVNGPDCNIITEAYWCQRYLCFICLLKIQ